MSRIESVVSGYMYHIFNRGVRKAEIFFQDKDYNRFELLLRWTIKYDYSFSEYQRQILLGKTVDINQFVYTEPIVRLSSWVLMPNHFHLVIEQLRDGGITKFLHRLSTAYAMYFNKSYNLSGSLFQGRYKAIRVNTDEQFIHLCRYIHTNPITAKLIDVNELHNYSWSSYKTYIDTTDDEITDTTRLLSYYQSTNDFVAFTKDNSRVADRDILEAICIENPDE